MAISDPISKTARWIAAARATESRRPDRLFEDRFAEILAGDEGFELMRRMASAAQPPGSTTVHENPYLPIRTRFMDDVVHNSITEQSILQVVLVAAGLDARAFRLSFPSGVRLFELDRPEVLHFKEQALSQIGAHPACERMPVPVDLTMSFRNEVIGKGFNPAQPSLWVLEGLLPYLTEAQARGVVAECTFLAAPESVLVADIVGVSFMRSPWIQPFLRALETINAPWQFATDQPEAFLASTGWRATAKRPGEDGASYGRWPYPAPPPRGTRGMPEVFLVTGVRDGATPVGA